MPESAKQKRKKTKRKGGNLFWPLCVLTALIIAFSLLYIEQYYRQKRRTENTGSSVIALLQTPAPDAASSAPTPSPTPAPLCTPNADTYVLLYPTPPAEVNLQFQSLVDINPDTVGYLHIPSSTTPIELIVVQRDNSFYLNHDFYGQPDKGGTLFLDQANEIWPQDQNMLIYGHNMKNGTMFARLTKYKSIVYAARNPIAYFDTLYENGTYVVYAAMRITAAESLSEDFNIRTFIFGQTSFDAFIYGINERALYVTNAGIDAGDQLLTLVTCSYNDDDERFILILRRLREGETAEDIRALIEDN